jgi:hypothetical protein
MAVAPLIEAEEVILPSPNLIEVDGVIIDAETGEVISVGLPEGEAEPTKDEVPESFIHHLLRKLTRIDAKRALAAESQQSSQGVLDAITCKYVELMEADPDYQESKAYVDKSNALRARFEKAGISLRLFYEDLFKRFALANLEGKERTYRSVYGDISLRKVPSKIAVGENPDLEGIEKLEPGAIKKSILVSKLPKALLESPALAEELGLQIIPADDSVTVSGAFKVGGA